MELATEYYSKALEILRNFGIQGEIARALVGLAKIAICRENLDDAKTNLQSALDVVSQSNHKIIEADIHNYMAELLIAQQNIQEAKRQAQLALEISSTAHYTWGQATALHMIGQATLELNEPVEAIQLLEKALGIRTQILDPRAEQTKELLQKIKAG